MKKPYIKKYKKFKNLTIWLVDGSYIREKIEKEFTNFGQHYRFKFIPQNEFWLDQEYAPGEEKYYVAHLLVENRLMAEGKSYTEAFKKANLIEKKERRKSKLIKTILEKKLNHEEIIKKIHKKLLKKYSQKVKVWIVNGELVRGLLFIDFTEGGHDKVYSFVPKNEVWLDDDIFPKERKFILLHELHERNLMCLGWSYDNKNKERSAHYSASRLEYFCRKNPDLLDKKLKEELNFK